MPLSSDIWLENILHIPSSHCDLRPFSNDNSSGNVDLLVIHNISLPPAQSNSDFDNDYVEDFFTGRLDHSIHSYFESIKDLRVSAHLYIKRDGTIVQFVPLNKRAWHAGVSEFQGRARCNDFSIGIELQGTDVLPYSELQYQQLILVTKQIQSLFPNIKKDHIVGHEHIAPGRKTDPGQSFDWDFYKQQL